MDLLQFFERLPLLGFDLVIDYQRALIDADYFDLRGMDSEGSRQSIHECRGSSRGEEFGKGPLHSDESLDGVSWLNVQGAVGGDVELKDVLDTDVSIFSTGALLDFSIHRSDFVPLVHWDNGPIFHD